MYDSNNDNNTGNNGLLSKFKLRLRLIRINRYKKVKNIKKEDEDNKKFIEDTVKKIHDIANNRDNYPRSKAKGIVKENNSNNGTQKNYIHRKDRNKTSLINKDGTDNKKVNDNIPMTEDKDSTNGFISNVIKNIRNTTKDRNYVRRHGIDTKKKILNINNDKNDEIEQLKVNIIKKIKREFEKKNAELDVLESELYFINKDNDLEVELEKVEDLKKKIQSIITKINDIIEQYNIYNTNYELDDTIYIDNNNIVDDIILFKNIVDSYKDKNNLVREYKLLDEFRELYNKLDHITEVANQLVIDNQNKINEYDIRDKKYDEIKCKIVSTNKILDKCDLEIESQNEYFKNLMSKINDINKNEYTIYKFQGISQLIEQSFKYISLLFVSPLAGLIPSIAINTLATRKMIKNIYNNMHLEKIDKVKYEAFNYEMEINNKLTDLDYTYALIDDTINIIDNLKSDFMLQYDSNLPGYEDTLKKINNIRDKVRGNRYKMDVIKNNLITSKKINEDKMIKVRKLNNE